MDDAAQSPKTQNGQDQKSSGQATVTQPQSTPPQQPVSPSPPAPGAVAHKEHAPVEHIKPSDPQETQPEIQAELKEHGVEVKQDEAKLELTREHYQTGMSHSPASQTVSPQISQEKPEFPMTHAEAEVTSKKASVWDPIRWLATLVLKQMKIKNDKKE